MPHRLMPLRAQRMLLARLGLEWFRTGYSWGEHGMEDLHFGTHADEVLVYMGLCISTCEGRPLTVAKAAAYTGLPRNTCHRRIEELCGRGVAVKKGRGYCITPGHYTNEAELEKVRHICNMVVDAGAKLSKMDPKAVA